MAAMRHTYWANDIAHSRRAFSQCPYGQCPPQITIEGVAAARRPYPGGIQAVSMPYPVELHRRLGLMEEEGTLYMRKLFVEASQEAVFHVGRQLLASPARRLNANTRARRKLEFWLRSSGM
jgi:hypothetical protein